jgi:hypothetical protein
MRSDEEIKRDVEEELRWDPDIDPTDIAVAVKCQTACNIDPRSASNFDPQGGCPGSA